MPDDEATAGKVHVATDEEEGHPSGKLRGDDEAEDAREQQGAVTDGVQDLAEPAHGLRTARNLAVHPVRACGERVDEDGERAVDVLHEHAEEDDGERHTRNGDGVCDREDLVGGILGATYRRIHVGLDALTYLFLEPWVHG